MQPDAAGTLADALRSAVVRLATLRVEADARRAGLAERRQTFEATIADERARLSGIEREIEATESEVRGLAKIAHETTGDRKPAPGVEIVMTKEYAVDEPAGLAWAQGARLCLIPESLDVKAVRKMAAAGVPLPFVQVTETPAVRLASNLVAALEKTIGGGV